MQSKTNFKDLVIETPVCEVFYKSISQGFHNEYTVRNIQLAVKEGKAENEFHFVFGGSVSMINDKTFKFEPPFKKGFLDVSYNLAFQLME